MQIRVAQAAGIAVILLAAGCGTVSTSPNATADPPPAVASPPDTAAPAPAPQPEPAPPPDTAAPAAAPQPSPRRPQTPPPQQPHHSRSPRRPQTPPPQRPHHSRSPRRPQPPDTAGARPPPAAAPQPEPAPPPDTAAPAPAPVEGDAPRDVLVGLFAGLRTAGESSAAYEREDYEHDRAYLCDTSGVDPYTGLAFDASSCDVDHIVAAKEAHESGGHSWDVATRERFGNDALNLVASRDCVNRSKGSSDTAEWSEVQSGTCEGAQLTAAGRCFWAARTVAVKYRYDLAVDARELTALESGLNQCPPDIDIEAPPQATLTTMPITQPSPPPAPSTETTASESDCHPAYDPCLPNLPGDALNCGDLTASQRPVSVKQTGVDPYRLDSDRDGQGCAG